MARFAKGSRALMISYRSGVAFPYREMVTEWNGSFVHNSEFEPKQPQIQPTRFTGDPQGLMNSRPARVELPTADFFLLILLQLKIFQEDLELYIMFLILIVEYK